MIDVTDINGALMLLDPLDINVSAPLTVKWLVAPEPLHLNVGQFFFFENPPFLREGGIGT